jgi:hypothetical protein
MIKLLVIIPYIDRSLRKLIFEILIWLYLMRILIRQLILYTWRTQKAFNILFMRNQIDSQFTFCLKGVLRLL